MKVIVKSPSDKYYQENHESFLEIQIDENVVCVFQDGEPEDNVLGRNFNDCYYIADIIKQAWEAGSKGESLEVEEIKVDDW